MRTNKDLVVFIDTTHLSEQPFTCRTIPWVYLSTYLEKTIAKVIGGYFNE
jgi:hypothetical protein